MVETSKNRIPLRRIQQTIGKRMLQSKQQIPCFYLESHADVTELMGMRHKLKKSLKVKITLNDFIIKAIGLAVKDFPLMAGQLDGQMIRIAETVNVGLAIGAPQGLVVPVLRQVEKKTLTNIATENAELTKKTLSNTLKPDELAGASITLSNLGAYGIDSFIAIVTPGQCSVMAVGNPIETCIPKEDGIMARKIISLNLSADHKIVNGAYAAKFLDSVVQQLQNPTRLID
jgi:pyruvate dehydrogenase E2 component (dihydrolipoamide acetyltransferase)